MKKFSKIICVVLMLAILCTGIVFAVSADDSTAAATHTVENVTAGGGTAIRDAVMSDVEGNQLAGCNPNFTQYQQKTDPNGDGVYTDGANTDKNMVEGFVITPADGDPYGMIAAGQYQNGMSYQNFQHTYNNALVPLKNDSYYVIDIDLATASEHITNLTFDICNRDANGSNFPFGDGDSVTFSKYLSDVGSEWHHFTVIGDIAANKLHVYVDGKLVDKNIGYAANPSQLGDKTAEEYGLHAQGLKLQVGYQAIASNNKAIYAGQSSAFDNLSRRNYTDNTAAAYTELKNIIDNDLDLSTWSDYPTVRTGSLVDLVEIDGVKYNNLADAKDVLSGNVAEAKVVNVLADSGAVLVVNCDATVNLNGYSMVVTSTVAGATVTEGEGVVTVDCPYVADLTFTAATNVTGPAALKSSISDNRITGFQWNIKPTNANGALPYIAETSDGNQFLFVDGTGVTLTSNSYIDAHVNIPIYYQAGKSNFIVFDYDQATLVDGTSGNNNVTTVPRNASGGGMWGGTSVLHEKATSDRYTFHHYTYVLDINANKVYLFVDGVSTPEGLASSNGGWTSAANFDSFKTSTSDSAWNYNSFRMLQTSDSLTAFDNLYVRYCEDDAALAEAIASGSINGWDGYVVDESYVMPEFPAAINIDGTDYVNVTEAATKLNGNFSANVEVLYPIPTVLNINCDATVETHGFDLNIVVPEGTTESANGTVVTYDVPYVASATFEELVQTDNNNGDMWVTAQDGVSATKEAITSALAGNVNTGFSYNKTSNFNLYLVTPAGSSDSFALMNTAVDKGTVDIQTQFTSSLQQLSSTTYTVVDVDFASDTSIGEYMYINACNRFQAGNDYPFSAPTVIADYIEADGAWHHMTIVNDFANNTQYVFVDGILVGNGVGYAYNASSVDTKNGAATIPENLYYATTKLSNDYLSKSDLYDSNDNLYVDNVSTRIFADNEAAGDIVAAIEAGTLDGWANAAPEKGGYLPVLATVNGEACYSAGAVTEAIANSADVADVNVERANIGNVNVDGQSANITTNGFDCNYEAVQSVTSYGEGDEKVTIVGQYIVSEADGAISFNRVTIDNADSNASLITWIIDEEAGIYDNVYYVYGQNIEYLGDNAIIANGNYIAGGNLTTFNGWTYLDSEGTPMVDDAGAPVTSLGVASEAVVYAVGMADYSITEGTDISIGNLLYNLTLYTDFQVNIYVPVAATDDVLSSVIVAIDGVDHYVISKSVDATQVAEDITYVVTFTKDGVKYAEEVVVSVIDYAVAVLDGDYSKMLKKTVMSALAYSAEACNALTTPNAEIGAILNNAAYAEFVVAGEEEYVANDMSALTGIVDSAQLSLDAAPTYVLNINENYAGTIVITYTGIDGEKTLTYEVEGGEQIFVEGLKAYDMILDYTITAGDAVAVYNLATYIKGLEAAGVNADFADALYTYASVASAYKTACNNVAGA